ncbi:hypothetical protein UVI_02028330 [Ustilaginoidea virens]|uniref:Uncharacterized protein n=1 Tax=Ustilaginoidea virens TaxID=1159556 RepID=A0A1B5KUU5_USTVR|nr:hypothetical protein UVI_02028330 [Ustilaginoidea virens]
MLRHERGIKASQQHLGQHWRPVVAATPGITFNTEAIVGNKLEVFDFVQHQWAFTGCVDEAMKNVVPAIFPLQLLGARFASGWLNVITAG